MQACVKMAFHIIVVMNDDIYFILVCTISESKNS